MDNTLYLSFQKDPYTLDPQKCGDQISSALIFLLFKGLTRLDANHTINCDLAESFQVTENSKTYVFNLGKHYWSNGAPITAEDFVYSWKRALHPDFPLHSTNFFYLIKNAEKAKKGLLPLDSVGVYAKNSQTLVVELEHACPYFLELTSFCPLFPVPSGADESNIAAICSGPFQIHTASPEKEYILQKNPSCKSFSSLKIDAIHIRIIPDEKEAYARFEKNELDWIGDPVSPLPLNYLPALLQTKKVKPVAGIVSCWFNTLKAPFNNLKLRNAFSYAIQREKILDKLMLPNMLSSSSPLPGILKGTVPIPSENKLSYAKELFHKALQELKIKHLKLTLAFETKEEHARLAMLLKADWEEAFPVTVVLKPLAFKEFFERLPGHEFHMTLFCALSQYTDLINFLERFEYSDSPRNFSGWENDKYKALLKKYRQTTDEEKRLKLVAQAESLLVEHMPVAPIYSYHYSYLQKPHVKNLAISPIGVVQFDQVALEKRQGMIFEEEPFAEQNYNVL